MPQYVEVYILDATREFDGRFTYAVPADFDTVKIGQIVEVPFGRGNSTRRALIADYTEPPAQPNKIKPLGKIIEAEPVMFSDQIFLAEEMRRRYFCSTAQALNTIAPPAVYKVRSKTERFIRLVDPDEVGDMLEAGEFRSLGQMRVCEMLLDVGEASSREIEQACHVTPAVISGLIRKGLAEAFRRETDRELDPIEPWPEPPVETLTPEQQSVLNTIFSIAETDAPLKEILLHGVTGSGKTEIYLRAAERILKSGKSAIILVPEISLTPLMMGRIAARFPDQVAVLHSRLTPAERFEYWQRIRRGEKRLVVGARSAVFAPLEDIGLIVIDEEQESSYQSESTPRYDAVEIARIRSIQHRCPLILGSATPSVVSRYRSDIGKSVRLVLPKRAKKDAVLPTINVVDMRREMAAGNFSIFSRDLREALEAAFARGEQAMLFLNRRGHSRFVLCRDCGYTLQCDSCDIAMTEHRNPHARHKGSNQMICHYCGAIEPVPEVCPECGSKRIGGFGVGTQQVEEEFRELFEPYKPMRMDLDTTSGRGAHERLLRKFQAGEADCLIGTQMIAKGHDFNRVTTVGILAADLMMNSAQFSAGERAYQLMTQAAGRAGRAERPGNVFIQAYAVNHPVIEATVAHDYEAFYRRELTLRKRAGYPPFGHIGMLLYSGLSASSVAAEAAQGQRFLEQWQRLDDNLPSIKIYPAMQAPVPKLRRRYRYRIILRSDNAEALNFLMTKEIDRKKQNGIGVHASIDAESMI